MPFIIDRWAISNSYCKGTVIGRAGCVSFVLHFYQAYGSNIPLINLFYKDQEIFKKTLSIRVLISPSEIFSWQNGWNSFHEWQILYTEERYFYSDSRSLSWDLWSMCLCAHTLSCTHLPLPRGISIATCGWFWLVSNGAHAIYWWFSRVVSRLENKMVRKMLS